MHDSVFTIQASVTRPNNTTQYTAKDVVNGSVAVPLIFKFPVVPMHRGYYILSPVLVSSNAPTTIGSFKLLLFEIPPTTPVDHAVFAPTLDQMAHLIAVIPFDIAVKISTGTFYVPDGFRPVYGTCLTVDESIYGVLIDDSGYTPAALESFRVVLNGEWDLSSCR